MLLNGWLRAVVIIVKEETAHHLVLTTQKRFMALPLLEEMEGSKGPRTMVTELAMALNHLWGRVFFVPSLYSAFYFMLLRHLPGVHSFIYTALNAPFQAWAVLQGHRTQM